MCLCPSNANRAATVWLWRGRVQNFSSNVCLFLTFPPWFYSRKMFVKISMILKNSSFCENFLGFKDILAFVTGKLYHLDFTNGKRLWTFLTNIFSLAFLNFSWEILVDAKPCRLILALMGSIFFLARPENPAIFRQHISSFKFFAFCFLKELPSVPATGVPAPRLPSTPWQSSLSSSPTPPPSPSSSLLSPPS